MRWWLGRASFALARRLWSAQPRPLRVSSGPGPRAKYTLQDGFLVSGVLTWLGFSPDPEPEHDLVLTIKRGVLAAKVNTK